LDQSGVTKPAEKSMLVMRQNGSPNLKSNWEQVYSSQIFSKNRIMECRNAVLNPNMVDRLSQNIWQLYFCV
jgi:hypothetical protein